MSALTQARDHLAKAREFLEAAEIDLDLELFSAATSHAVIAGINSKDAICLRLTGRTTKGDNHHEAVAELKAAGPEGADVAATMSRLVKLKTKAQYLAPAIARTDASKAVEWATRMVEQAVAVVSR